MSKLYAIRQTKFDKYWYDFVEDFTSPTLDFHCVSANLDYVKESQQSLMKCNPAWKDSEIVELGIIADLEAKLAESEEKNNKLKDEVCKSNVGIAHLKNQLKQAKEKLAKKDKEIERLLIAKELLFSDLHYARMDCEKTNRQIRELDKSCGSIINNLTTQIEELKKEKK